MENVIHRYFTEAEQTQLLRAVQRVNSREARRDAAWIALLRDSGMRIGELAKMQPAAARLALERGWLFIPKAHRKGKRRDHNILVTDSIRKDLQQLLAVRPEFSRDDAPDAPLIYSRRLTAMSIRGFQDRFAFWASEAGIKGSPHWMRHTRAMNIMRRSTSNDPRGIVQAALGHDDISSSGIYTQMSKEDLVRELQAVDVPRRARRRDMRALYEGVAA